MSERAREQSKALERVKVAKAEHLAYMFPRFVCGVLVDYVNADDLFVNQNHGKQKRRF